MIDSLDIDFPEGLVIITGQTGAGKSILLGALSLLTGSRADASCISAGASRCIVEGEFVIEGDMDSLSRLLSDNDVDCEDGRLLIRRVVNDSGRSRSFINDSPVPVQLLADLSSHLVDIHSQHRSLLLADRRFQLSVLDHYSGNAGRLQECRKLWTRMQEAASELEAVRYDIARLNADAGYNAGCFAQLDKAALKEGELEELDSEQKQLSNAEEIKSSLQEALEMFNPSDDSLRGLDASLKEACRQLDRISRFLPAMSSLSERIQSSRIELEDICSELSTAADKIDLSEDRLRQVEDRMSLLYDLMHRYSCSDIPSLIAERDRFGACVTDVSLLQEKEKVLEKDLEGIRTAFSDVCSELRKSREKSAPALAKALQDSLRFLELERAVFRIDLADCEPGPSGGDAVTFMFSSNGTAAADVAKCASGGELSRIMLSLKAMMARFTGMPTMIFDEIDTGVSGSVADRMGSMICAMGKDMQVIAITHLPQVAAKGDSHFVVSKTPGADKAVTTIRPVSGEDRVNEIARLLSGASITPEAVANARALLNAD